MIIDSSTLILLAKSGLLDILIRNLKTKLIISKKVEIESILKEDAFDAKLIKQRIKEDNIIIKKIKNLSTYQKLLVDFNLGGGEAEAITLSLEEKQTLLIDDKKAINVCKILNVKFVTALNILVYLYKKKSVSQQQAELMLKKLNEYGRYPEELIKKVKEDIGG